MQFRDDREQKSLLGVDESELSKIESVFSDLLSVHRAHLLRKRAVGGGRRGSLPTSRDKVIFCLYYLKNYPTFDHLGHKFNLSRSSAFEALQKWTPFLRRSLERLQVLPESIFDSPEAISEYFEKKDQSITDRRYRTGTLPA